MNSKKYCCKISLISLALLIALCLCSCANDYAFHGVPLAIDSDAPSQNTNAPISDNGEGYDVPDVTTTDTEAKEKEEETTKQTEIVTFNDEEPIVLKDLDKYFAELEKELENIEEDRDDDKEEYVEPDPDYEKIQTTAFSGEHDFYDVPLHPMKQQWVIETAEAFNISPIMIFGVMKVESNYHETSISSNGKYIGIMQVAKGHLSKLNSYFGITDLQDFQQCTYAGAYYLSYYVSYSKRLNTKYYGGDKDIDDMTLMCYHMGEGGAANKWDKGTFSDSYSTKVKNEMTRIAKAGPVSAEYVINKYGL